MAPNPINQLHNTIIRTFVRNFSKRNFVDNYMGTPLPTPVKDADPVIYVHGVTDSGIGGRNIARSLARDGFTMYMPTMPMSGLNGVMENAAYLKRYVDEVRRRTGRQKVDLVGHSQGGLTIMAYIRFFGGADAVDSAISIGVPHHGVNFWGPIVRLWQAIPLLNKAMPDALPELMEGSPLITALTAGDETPGNVRYTSIYSRNWDGVVNPASSPRLKGARNVELTKQDWLPGIQGPHHILMNHYSDETYEAVRAALMEPRAVADARQGARRGGRRRRAAAAAGAAAR